MHHLDEAVDDALGGRSRNIALVVVLFRFQYIVCDVSQAAVVDRVPPI